jgi:hypothetical protein
MMDGVVHTIGRKAVVTSSSPSSFASGPMDSFEARPAHHHRPSRIPRHGCPGPAERARVEADVDGVTVVALNAGESAAGKPLIAALHAGRLRYRRRRGSAKPSGGRSRSGSDLKCTRIWSSEQVEERHG